MGIVNCRSCANGSPLPRHCLNKIVYFPSCSPLDQTICNRWKSAGSALQPWIAKRTPLSFPNVTTSQIADDAFYFRKFGKDHTSRSRIQVYQSRLTLIQLSVRKGKIPSMIFFTFWPPFQFLYSSQAVMNPKDHSRLQLVFEANDQWPAWQP